VTDELDLARFRALADAYGGSLARWPLAYRSAATRLAATSEGATVLEYASMLDDRLDTWRVRPVPDDLSSRIVAGAPMPAASLATRARLWWSGFGVAAALAGAAAGAATVLVAVPADPVADGGTSFGELTDAGDER